LCNNENYVELEYDEHLYRTCVIIKTYMHNENSYVLKIKLIYKYVKGYFTKLEFFWGLHFF